MGGILTLGIVLTKLEPIGDLVVKLCARTGNRSRNIKITNSADMNPARRRSGAGSMGAAMTLWCLWTVPIAGVAEAAPTATTATAADVEQVETEATHSLGEAPVTDAAAIAVTAAETASEADNAPDSAADAAAKQHHPLGTPHLVNMPEVTPEPIAGLLGSSGSEFDSSLQFAAQQIETGEATEAMEDLKGMVQNVEQRHHRYHEDLVAPLMLMGDAQVKLGKPEAALDLYDRARHVARVSYGLFDPRQVNVVYREAETLRLIGNIRDAASREEYAYEVASRAFNDYDAQLLPPMIRLANFYLSTAHPIHARTLLNQAFRIHQLNKTTTTPAAVEVLRGIAATHRTERFPPVFIPDDDVHPDAERLQPGLRSTELDQQYRTINSFPKGEKALQQVVEIQRTRFGENSEAELAAVLELADWHLLFGKAYKANTLYRHIYQQMETAERDAAGFFAQPVLIHFPRPANPEPPRTKVRGELAQGTVELNFGISSSGRVRSLKTVLLEGENKMNFRVRRSMRAAVFRPRVVDGQVVGADGQSFSYEYPYFKRLDAASEPAAEVDGNADQPNIKETTATPAEEVTS